MRYTIRIICAILYAAGEGIGHWARGRSGRVRRRVLPEAVPLEPRETHARGTACVLPAVQRGVPRQGFRVVARRVGESIHEGLVLLASGVLRRVQVRARPLPVPLHLVRDARVELLEVHVGQVTSRARPNGEGGEGNENNNQTV